jgi:hypothetical protein
MNFIAVPTPGAHAPTVLPRAIAWFRKESGWSYIVAAAHDHPPITVAAGYHSQPFVTSINDE